MNRNALTPFRTRLANLYQGLVAWFRRFSLKKLMGWILILKTLNLVWLVLLLVLFVFLTIDNVKDNFSVPGEYFAAGKQKFEAKVGSLNVIGYIKNKVDGIELMVQGFSAIFGAIGKTIMDLLKRTLIFLAVVAIWMLLTLIASVYSEWSLGPGGRLIRGVSHQPAPGASPGVQPQPVVKLAPPPLDTPPILIIGRVRIALPVLLEDENLPKAGERSRSFGYGERFLLFAQAVWPDRFIPMYYHQLADQEDADDWAFFWQSLIKRGLQPAEVETVISTDIAELKSSVRYYLPHAGLQQSVETTIITS